MNPAIASWFERIRRDNLLDDDLEKTKLFLILSNCIAMQIMDRSVSHGGQNPVNLRMLKGTLRPPLSVYLMIILLRIHGTMQSYFAGDFE